MKPIIRKFLSRNWPFLVWCAVGLILFWPVMGYYVALPAPDSPPFFAAGHRLRFLEQILAGTVALSPHHLLSLLLPPLILHDLIYLLDTLLIATGCAYFLRGRDLPPVAAWIGGGILAFAGYSFTLVSAGHIGFFHMTVYATFMFGFLVRALCQGRWPYFALVGIFAAWTIMFAPDFGPILLLLAVAYGLWLLARNAARQSWKVRLRQLIVGLPIAALCFLLGAWSTIRIILTEHVQKRESQIQATAPRTTEAESDTAAAATDPQAKWIFATNWSLPPSEIAEFVAPCLFGTQSGDPQAPYWGKLGRTLGWEQHHQGYPNFRQHAVYLGGLQLMLAAFAIGCWFKRRRQGSGFRVQETGDGRRESAPAFADRLWRGTGGSRQPVETAAPAVPAISNDQTAPWLDDVPFWAGVWLIGLLLALGRHAPLYRLFYSLPYMSLLRAPVKFIRFVELATAVLAASGLACLLQPGARWLRSWTIGAGVCASLGLLAAIWASGADATIRQVLEPMGLAPAAALLKGNLIRALLHGTVAFAVAAAVFALRSTSRNRMVTLLALAVAWLAVDAILVDRHFITAWDLTSHYRPNSIVKQIVKEDGPAPVVANYASPNLQHDWFSASFIANDIFNCVPSPQAPETDLFRQLQERLQADPLRFWELCGARHVVLPLQAARALAGPRLKPISTLQLVTGEVRAASDESRASVLAQVPKAMPYAWLTPTWSVVPETESLQAVASRADERRTIVVGTKPAEFGSPEATAGTVEVVQVRDQANSLKTVIEIDASTDQFLVLRHSAQASLVGATLDGKPEALQRANHVWMGLPVPAGHHRIEVSVARDLVALGLNSLPLLVLLGLLAAIKHKSTKATREFIVKV